MPHSSKLTRGTPTKPARSGRSGVATISTFSKDGKKSGTLTIPKELQETRVNHDLLHQVATGLLGNLRHSTAHTKTRGEVSGGGRKPWRQKGTGRARAGSSRSPLWRGGGITHGPRKNRNYGVRLNNEMRRVSFRQALAAKIKDGEIFVVANVELPKPKTKLMEAFLQRLPLKEGQLLLVVDKLTEELTRAANNIPYLTVRSVQTVGLLDLLTSDSVIITKPAFMLLESRYASR